MRWRSGRYPLRLGAGIPVWACSVALGMLLRAVTGQGTAASFVLVASLVLGVLLLAARLAARRIAHGTLPRGDGR